ncbi:MAG: FAD-binding protein [Dehalococcoidia bacterium]|nr:FAD-binding protein [Dehalococcoidia bacterium]
MQKIQCDVLVIGGGLAGCWAAIRARDFVEKVTLIDKAVVARSGASTFTNSMLAPPPDGEFDAWLTEIVEAGEYLSNQEWVRNVLMEQPLRIEQMAGWGVPFERDDRGKLLTTPGRGHKRTGLIMCNGHRLMEAMKKKVVEMGVRVIPRIMMVELLTDDGKYPTGGKVVGAAGFHTREGDFVICRAKSVVITTGIIESKLRTFYINNQTGDGPAMAFRAGAELLGMEFCSVSKIVHFEGKYCGGGSSLLQGLGARFINGLDEEFVGKYDPGLKNRARVGALCQSFAKEHFEGRGPVYLDMTSYTEEKANLAKKLLSSQMKPFERAGINIREHPLEINPLVSVGSPSGQGGIRVDTGCRSSIRGLFAAGSAARNLVHGTYSVGGVNLAFCNVSGYRAGEEAGKYASGGKLEEPDDGQTADIEKSIFAPLNDGGNMTPDEAITRFHRITIPAPVSLFKREDRLIKASERLDELAAELGKLKAKDVHELVKAREISNLVLLGQLVFTASLLRTESRDTHYREDYPFRDDVEWLKWIIAVRGPGGEAVLRKEEVPLERYPVKPAARLRIPHLVQYSLKGAASDY